VLGWMDSVGRSDTSGSSYGLNNMAILQARLYDWFMAGAEKACLKQWRKELLGRASGRILEIGAGTGASLEAYPAAALESLVLSDPDKHMLRILEKRCRERAAVRTAKMAADALPFQDGELDCVVSMLVLCTVADQGRALREMRRVLKPGGHLIFLEHVAAPADSERYKWQCRLRWVWGKIACGCDVTRRTEEAILANGFDFKEIVRGSMRKAMPILRPCIRGIAVKM
jgi:ubiquinone/menaquinone biosynthesis C-methylase UbiE